MNYYLFFVSFWTSLAILFYYQLYDDTAWTTRSQCKGIEKIENKRFGTAEILIVLFCRPNRRVFFKNTKFCDTILEFRACNCKKISNYIIVVFSVYGIKTTKWKSFICRPICSFWSSAFYSKILHFLHKSKRQMLVKKGTEGWKTLVLPAQITVIRGHTAHFTLNRSDFLTAYKTKAYLTHLWHNTDEELSFRNTLEWLSHTPVLAIKIHKTCKSGIAVSRNQLRQRVSLQSLKYHSESMSYRIISIINPPSCSTTFVIVSLTHCCSAVS